MINEIEKVIFDTNAVRNESSPDCFLGGRAELERFQSVAEIYLPEMVIAEIRAQKRKQLQRKKESFLTNIFHRIRGINEAETREFDIDAFVAQQEKDESIPYKIVTSPDSSVLPEMMKMVVLNQPPFDAQTDRGFKDTCVYFSILKFLESIPGEYVYLVTGDGRLKAAFEKNDRVRVVSGFEEFQRYRMAYFTEEYFVQKLQAEVNADIQLDHIQDAWLNTNGNWVLLIETEESTFRVEVDFTSREIEDSITADFPAAIQSLVVAGSFRATHSAISTLNDLIPYLSDVEILQLFEAANQNEQIKWVAEDNDVKEFYLALYKNKHQILPEDTRTQFLTHFPAASEI